MPATPDRLIVRLPADQVHVWLRPRAASERSMPGLRQVLQHYLGDEARHAPIHIGPHGRPELAAPHQRLGFSASHAGPWLLLAFGLDLQPGIDIEALAPRPNAGRLAQRYFNAAETRALLALPEHAQQRAFYQSWTAREAVLKAIGRGLAFGLDRLHFAFDGDTPRLLAIADDQPQAWQIHAQPAPDGFLATLAWRGPPRVIVRMSE